MQNYLTWITHIIALLHIPAPFHCSGTSGTVAIATEVTVSAVTAEAATIVTATVAAATAASTVVEAELQW